MRRWECAKRNCALNCAHPDTTRARCDGSVCVETYARMSVTRLPPPRPRKIAATTRYGYDGASPRKRQPRPHIADEIRIAEASTGDDVRNQIIRGSLRH